MMTRRELSGLTRADLLEMLIVKCQENERLQTELEKTKRQLADRPAETTPDRQVNALMQALKVAAEQYLENMRQTEDKAQ